MLKDKINIHLGKELIKGADAVLIGGGSGLSSAAGLTYGGDRFKRNFGEFIEKYGMTDMYTAGFYPFQTLEEKWGYWAQHIYMNRYEPDGLELYKMLFEIVKNKRYFVITTNVDAQFVKSGFDEEKIFEVQGNYGELQCSLPCHKKVYDNEEIIRKILRSRKKLKVPKELLPKCPICGRDMTTHLRVDSKFVETDLWNEQNKAYENFIRKNADKKLVLLELGVGFNTPSIIRFPFEIMEKKLEKANLIRVNNQKYADENHILQIDDEMREVFEAWID